jgi:hypothetical protein
VQVFILNNHKKHEHNAEDKARVYPKEGPFASGIDCFVINWSLTYSIQLTLLEVVVLTRCG